MTAQSLTKMMQALSLGVIVIGALGTLLCGCAANNRPVAALASSASPYLQLHKNDLVHWRPWSASVIAEAALENKPIMVCLGFSACHWCHVMQKESFNDPATADYLNQNFVCILVDREERPDVDERFAAQLRALKVRVGWPMTVFVRRDGTAYMAGTYYPPGDLNTPGSFRQILKRAREAFATADKGSSSIANDAAAESSVFKKENFEFALRRLVEKLDRRNGGLKGTRKYPPVAVLALAQSLPTDKVPPAPVGSADSSVSILKSFADETLVQMASGQIYDPLDGGFFRFATRPDWRRPHFEKMLESNAQLARLYTESQFDYMGFKVLGFVLERFSLLDGCFATSLDADSNGGEGGYYTFSYAAMKSILTAPELEELVAVAGVTEAGNCGTNANVLSFKRGSFPSALALSAVGKLRVEQRKRQFPARNENIITAPNAMAISALVAGYRKSKKPAYWQAATKAADAILKKLYANNVLSHSTKVAAFLDDYAYLESAMLDLYSIDKNVRWLRVALALNKTVSEEFLDKDSGLFYFNNIKTPIEQRVVATTDGTASAAGVAVENLLRLAAINETFNADRPALKAKANQILNSHAKLIQAEPVRFAYMLKCCQVR
jgi:uncharacterized protein YyaL (SSP411 family)